MSEQQQDQQPDSLAGGTQQQLTGHIYDGIQEYDNPTPAWMTWVFLAFFLFTPIYLLFTLLSDGQLTPQGQYERAYVANLEKKFGELGTLEPDAATIIKYANDEQWLAFGKNVYDSKGCAACHGTQAEGNSAPNLTDDYFKNVKQIEDLGKVLIEGAANGAMPAWGNRLHPNEIVLVSSYVASLKGTNVAGGKGPEGEVIEGDWIKLDAPEPSPEPEAQ